MDAGSSLPRVQLFTKACCPLCDEAKEAIAKARARCAFSFEEVDIESDPALYERYRYLIPVLSVNGREVFYGKVSAHRLVEVLRACRGGSPPSLSRRYVRFLERLKSLLSAGRGRGPQAAQPQPLEGLGLDEPRLEH